MSVKHGQTIEVPPQYDPARTEIVLVEDFSASVGKVHEHAKIDHQRDHNHTVGQMDVEGSALTNGRRGLSHKNPVESLAARKKKEKDRAMMRTALKQLLDRLEELYEEIAAINERLREIDTELTELERLQKLAEQGTLDPNNPAHAKLLKKYGITQEDIESGNLSLILTEKLGQRIDERTELQKRKESLMRKAHRAISEAQADGTITPEEAARFDQRLKSSDAGVSAQVRITAAASQELKDIAGDHFTDALDEEIPEDELELGMEGNIPPSFAASLDKRQGELSSKETLKTQFTATAKGLEDLSQSEKLVTFNTALGQRPS